VRALADTAATVLTLQRLAGNQAVGRLLARDPKKPKPMKTPPKAPGKGTGADTGKDSDSVKAQLDALEKRQDLKRMIENQYDDIHSLRKDLIDTWITNARVEDPPSHLWQFMIGAIGVVIAIVSEGVGGIVYSMVHDALKKRDLHELTKEFFTLAGLEAGDLAAEMPLRAALDLVDRQLVTGINKARGNIKDTFTDAAVKKLAEANRGDVISTYAAAMKLQVHMENDATKDEFNQNSASKSLTDLQQLWAGQRITHDLLLQEPGAYLEELTSGYVSMLDRAEVAHYSEDQSRSEILQAYADRSQLSLGLLDLKPDKEGEHYDHFIGKWSDPKMDFPAFQFGVYGLNEALEKDLIGKTPQDFPHATLRVRFRAANPYSGWFQDEQISVAWVIDEHGRYYVTDSGNVREWLASYFTGLSREHSDEERAKYAPLGARKFWEKVNTKPLKWLWYT
jgi:hypothetical protein